MAFNSLITRTNAEALIPEEVSREILKSVPQASTFMRLARRLPNMSRAQLRLPVSSALAMAYIIDGDTSLKQTTNAEWENKYIDAGELAAIVPISTKVLDDADYDIWAEVQPQIVEAMGMVFDRAVFYGTNAISAWPTAIVTAATTASHTVTLGAGADLYEDIMGVSGTLALIEADGFNPTGHIGALSMKAKLRGLRDADGVPIFMQSMQGSPTWALDGAPVLFPENGGVVPGTALLISGDWTKVVYSIRQDVTYKVLTEGVIQDAGGNIVYNLAQQDMVAIRAVMRVGWQLPNPVNRINATAATRYPFAVLLP